MREAQQKEQGRIITCFAFFIQKNKGEEGMDLTTLISSVISGAVAICVCLINQRTAQRKQDTEQDMRLMQIQSQHEQTVAIITCKLDELDRKQTIHNSVIDRVYKLESFNNLQNEKNLLYSRELEELKRKVKTNE